MNILNDRSDQITARQNGTEQVQLQKQEFKLLGTYLRTPGLNLYCYNSHKNIVELVQVKNNCTTCVMIPLKSGGYLIEPYEKPKIEVDTRWDYFEALNINTAIKRVNKYKQGKINSIWNLKLANDPKKLKL